ncbi:MAG: glutathione S-transferase family protein [Acetobacteraceae bacterium]|nr:glutathione S-transferase family protein [Acetobacteraceae bacterium]
MIKLWGRTTSSNVMKVLWTLDELALPYERIDAGGAFGGTDTAEYRRMNPLGLVPSIEDGGLRLFESNSIIRYLCNAYAPDSTLYPRAPGPRAEVEAWMDFQQTAQSRPASTIFIGLIRTPAERRDQGAIAAAVVELGRIWAICGDRAAAQGGFLCGPAPSLADIAFGPHLHRWFHMPIDNRPDLPRLRAWYDAMRTRPAFLRHVAVAVE